MFRLYVEVDKDVPFIVAAAYVRANPKSQNTFAQEVVKFPAAETKANVPVYLPSGNLLKSK